MSGVANLSYMVSQEWSENTLELVLPEEEKKSSVTITFFHINIYACSESSINTITRLLIKLCGFSTR